MKHFKIIILIILFLFNHKSYAEENIVEILKKNNNIIFLRHSLAPGSGDPENINLKDCKTPVSYTHLTLPTKRIV